MKKLLWILSIVSASVCSFGQSQQSNYYNGTSGGSSFNAPTINNKWFIDGTTYTSPQSIYANPNFKGGTIDWTLSPNSTYACGGNGCPDLFQNTLQLAAPTVVEGACSGISATNKLNGAKFLTVFIAQWDNYGDVVYSLPTTIQEQAVDCYTVTPAAPIFSGLGANPSQLAGQYSVFALECASACAIAASGLPPVQGTMQFSGGPTNNTFTWTPDTTARNFGITTASTTPLAIGNGCNVQGASGSTNCIMGFIPPPADAGLMVNSTVINLNTNGGTLQIFPTDVPQGSRLVGQDREVTTQLQLSNSAPNGIPTPQVPYATLTSGGSLTSGQQVEVRLAYLEAGQAGPQSEVVVGVSSSWISPQAPSTCAGSGNCQATFINPEIPLMLQPRAASTFYAAGERVSDNNAAPAVWMATIGGTTGTGSFTSSCSAVGASATTAVDGGVTWTCILLNQTWANSTVYQAPPATGNKVNEVWDAAHSTYQMAMITGGGTCTSNGTPTFSAVMGGTSTGDAGCTWMNMGGANLVVSPQFQWYSLVCAGLKSTCLTSVATQGFSPQMLLSGTGGQTTFSGCSGTAKPGQVNNTATVCNGTTLIVRNTSISATGAGAALSTVMGATLTDVACPTGFNCVNTAAQLYLGGFVYATANGITPLQAEGNVTPTATHGIQVTAPVNFPPNATGWIPVLTSNASATGLNGTETMQLPDGLNVQCGNGAQSNYTAGYAHGWVCSKSAATATIANIQQNWPPMPLFNTTDTVFTIGGMTPLMNQAQAPVAANNQVQGYGSRVENIKLECGRNFNSIEPYGLAFWSSNGQENSGAYDWQSVDCAQGGWYQIGQAAQNAGTQRGHILGVNADYSWGLTLQDVSVPRGLRDFSASAWKQNSQWDAMWGVMFVNSPTTVNTNMSTEVADVECEETFDCIASRNAQFLATNITTTSTTGRKVLNTVHLDQNSFASAALLVRGMGGGCPIQNDLKDPSNCRENTGSSETFYLIGDIGGAASTKAPEFRSRGMTGLIGTPIALTAQTGNIGATTLYTSQNNNMAGGIGFYRVCVTATTTTAGATSVAPAVNVIYGSNPTTSAITSNLPAWVLTSTTVAESFSGCADIFSGANQAIQVSTSGGTYNNSPQYSFNATVEFLGSVNP